MNVTWRRFDQAAKQLIVVHTTIACIIQQPAQSMPVDFRINLLLSKKPDVWTANSAS